MEFHQAVEKDPNSEERPFGFAVMFEPEFNHILDRVCPIAEAYLNALWELTDEAIPMTV